jgi:hypothetical protein
MNNLFLYKFKVPRFINNCSIKCTFKDNFIWFFFFPYSFYNNTFIKNSISKFSVQTLFYIKNKYLFFNNQSFLCFITIAKFYEFLKNFLFIKNNFYDLLFFKFLLVNNNLFEFSFLINHFLPIYNNNSDIKLDLYILLNTFIVKILNKLSIIFYLIFKLLLIIMNHYSYGNN